LNEGAIRVYKRFCFLKLERYDKDANGGVHEVVAIGLEL